MKRQHVNFNTGGVEQPERLFSHLVVQNGSIVELVTNTVCDASVGFGTGYNIIGDFFYRNGNVYFYTFKHDGLNNKIYGVYATIMISNAGNLPTSPTITNGNINTRFFGVPLRFYYSAYFPSTVTNNGVLLTTCSTNSTAYRGYMFRVVTSGSNCKVEFHALVNTYTPGNSTLVAATPYFPQSYLQNSGELYTIQADVDDFNHKTRWKITTEDDKFLLDSGLIDYYNYASYQSNLRCHQLFTGVWGGSNVANPAIRVKEMKIIDGTSVNDFLQ